MIRRQNGLDSFALWHDPTTTGTIIDALKEALPETSKPSHFVLTAHEVLADLCPDGAAVEPDEEYQCFGSGHDVSVMAGAMHNWHHALCAEKIEPEWQVCYVIFFTVSSDHILCCFIHFDKFSCNISKHKSISTF